MDRWIWRTLYTDVIYDGKESCLQQDQTWDNVAQTLDLLLLDDKDALIWHCHTNWIQFFPILLECAWDSLFTVSSSLLMRWSSR